MQKRLWIKSSFGIRAKGLPFVDRLCHFTISQDQVFQVHDASIDPRFMNDPLTAGDVELRFYAAATLKSPSGHHLGTLSVISDEPQRLSREQSHNLQALADQVVSLFELRLRLKKEQKASALKSKFVSTAAHQFRTPLTVIQSNTELLQFLAQADADDISWREKLSRYTIRISRETERMKTLVDETLILTKLRAKKKTSKLQMTNMQSLLSMLCEQFDTMQAGKRKVSFTVKGRPWDFLIRPTQVRDAIENLLSNAFKYSTVQNPELLLEYGKEEVTILIKDKGIGIPSDELDRLFSPYYRASNARDLPGTGLGLSIAKEQIQSNHGRISVESQLNRGTTFRITFPRAIPQTNS